MSETMSASADWLQFYQNQLLAGQSPSPSPAMFGDRVSDATAVTTNVTSPSAHQGVSLSTLPGGVGGGGGGGGGGGSGHLNPAEGRVSKPIRRRSRASRRTPTTLLNTDTNNFRAMVQQFTGGPCGPFSTGAHPSALTFNFGIGGRQQQQLQQQQLHHHGRIGPAGLMFPTAATYPFPFQRQQQPQQQYMLSLNNSSPGGGGGGGSGGDAFLQRLSNPRPHAAVSEGFMMEGMGPRPSSSNDDRTSGFLF